MCVNNIIYWIFFDILECDYKMSMQFSSHVESPERVFHLPGVCMDLCMVVATLAPCWHHARSLDQDTAGNNTICKLIYPPSQLRSTRLAKHLNKSSNFSVHLVRANPDGIVSVLTILSILLHVIR